MDKLNKPARTFSFLLQLKLNPSSLPFVEHPQFGFRRRSDKKIISITNNIGQFFVRS